jgi:hypothetical protein
MFLKNPRHLFLKNPQFPQFHLLLSFPMNPKFLKNLSFLKKQKYPQYPLILTYLLNPNSHLYPQSLMYPKYPYLKYLKYQKFDHSFLKSLKHHRLRYLPK